MGFKKPTTIYRLKFEGIPEYEGLEVDVKSVSSATILRLARLKDTVDESDETPLDEVNEMIDVFADALVKWNLEEDNGDAVPTTRAAVAELEIAFLLKLIMAWTKAVAGISDDLKKDLNSGLQFPEGSMMKDASLANLMNS